MRPLSKGQLNTFRVYRNVLGAKEVLASFFTFRLIVIVPRVSKPFESLVAHRYHLAVLAETYQKLSVRESPDI